VAAAVLLLPDVSSIEIPGIVRLERKVEAQAKRQEEDAEEIKRLVMQQSQSQGQSQGVAIFQANLSARDTARLFQLIGVQDTRRRELDDPDAS
jgi:hypothetical protein